MHPPSRIAGLVTALLLILLGHGTGTAGADVVELSTLGQQGPEATTFFLDDGVLFGYSMSPGELWYASDPDQRLLDPRISPDGTMFVAGPRPLHVGSLDGEWFRQLSGAVFHSDGHEWSHDSTHIHVRNRDSIDVVDVETGDVRLQVDVSDRSELLGSTPDGFAYHEIAADGAVGDLVFYDTTAAREVHRVDASDSRVLSLRSDGTEAVVQQGLEILRLTVADGSFEHIANLPGHGDTIMSPDGRYLLKRSELERSATRVAATHHLHLLEVETNETIPILEGDFIRIGNMQWLPDSSGFILDHRDGAGSPFHRHHVSTTGAMNELDVLGQVVGAVVVPDESKGPMTEEQRPSEEPEPAQVGESEPIANGLVRTETSPVLPTQPLAQSDGVADGLGRIADSLPRAFVEVDDQLVELSLPMSSSERVALSSELDSVGPWAASENGNDVAYHTGLGGRPGYLQVVLGATTRRLDFGGPAYATSGIGWSADGALVFDHAVGTDDRRIAMVTFDGGEASEIDYLTSEGRSSFLLAAAADRIVYFERVPLTGEDGVVVYDTATRSVVARLPAIAITEGTPASLSHDGAVGSVRIGPSLFAWDLTSGDATVVEGDWRTVGQSRVAPDGTSIAYLVPAAAESHELILHDVAGATATSLGAATGRIGSFEWLPDSSGLVATVGLGPKAELVHFDLEGNQTRLGIDGVVGRVTVGASAADGFSCVPAESPGDCASLLLAPSAPTVSEIVGEAADSAGDSQGDRVESSMSEDETLVNEQHMAALLEELERERNAQQFTLRVPASSTYRSSDGDSILDTRSGRRLVFGVPLMLIYWALKSGREQRGPEHGS